MTDDGLLGRAELERAFAALGDRLVRRGVVADLFIVGGAAMALAYDADRVTRDVDATFVPHGVVLEEARNVAQAMGLPPWWLNEQASSYVSAQHDAGKREVFDHPGIRFRCGRGRCWRTSSRPDGSFRSGGADLGGGYLGGEGDHREAAAGVDRAADQVEVGERALIRWA